SPKRNTSGTRGETSGGKGQGSHGVEHLLRGGGTLVAFNSSPKLNKSEDKKIQSKGKKGPKGKQTEETNQEQTKDNLPAENGEAKSEEAPVSDAAGEKEPKSE
uniref:High mobility group nucleosome binding domain 1 n=1 Tax=Crocodylus porosus TaxID=8502 RepID=A0A7M4FFX2_CROPO